MQPRTTFGFARTECACEQCVLNCRHMPSFLLPEDLPVLAARLGYDNWEKFEPIHNYELFLVSKI